jgi:hypothetical protein
MKLSILTPRMRQLAPFAIVFLSAISMVVAYFQALHYPFISDDTVYITENTKLAELHFTDLWRLFTEPYNRYEFLPIRDLSYWFDITLFGTTPIAFHMHNIILYLLCLPLVYSTTLGLWRYFRADDAQNALWAAVAVTILFAVHPAHVESVVWISGRKDVLSGLFSMLALWLAVNARRERGLSSWYAVAALIAFLAAMLSKATVVTVAPIIALIWVIFWHDTPKQSRHHSNLLWSLASLLLAAGVTLIFMRFSAVKEPTYFGIEFFTRALAILGWLARLSISPESRQFFYPVFEDNKLPVMIGIGVIVLLATSVVVVTMQRKKTLVRFSLVSFLLFCLPFTQLIPFITFSLVSDRFLFLSVWPVMMMAVVLAWYLKPMTRIILLSVIVLAWGGLTIERIRDWRSDEALIDSDIHAYPRHYQPISKRIWDKLSLGLNRDAGEIALTIAEPKTKAMLMKIIRADYAVRANAVDTKNPANAVKILKDLEITLKNPPDQVKWNSPMRHIWERCKINVALEWNLLSRQFPDKELVRYMAGLWKLEVYSFSDAVIHLSAATESQRLPQTMRGLAYKNLAVALMESGDLAKAKVALDSALVQFPPELSSYCVLAELYKRNARFEDALHAASDCQRLGSEQKETLQ